MMASTTMTTATRAQYVKSTKLATSNPNLYATATSRKGSSRGDSRNRKQSFDSTKNRVFLSSTPHGTQKQLKDEDLESIIDLSEDVLPYDETGKRCYANACQKLDVVPSSYIMSKLASSKMIDCKHYGLGPKGTMALSIALVINNRVTSLNLQGNDVGKKGISYLQKMISESHVITELNISDNKLGTEGAIAINKMLTENRSIIKLEMAGNEFTDADAVHLTKALQEHPDVEVVDLSHNKFGDLSAELFGDMICENSVLQQLDLSWNLFRIIGTTAIAKGLKENTMLKKFIFSWNGFDDAGAMEFAKAIKVNSVLVTLDLTCCRIGHDGFIKIITAIGLNESLQHLLIGKNKIPEEYAEAGLSMLRTYPVLKLETLDLSDCTFSPKFNDHVSHLNEMHHNIKVIHGYAITYGQSNRDFIGDILKEGLECLRDFCKESGVSLVELFERFDADNSMSVSLQEFQEGLKEAGVPLSLYKIEMFANALDKDGDGEVDYSEMVLQLKQFEES